MSTVDPIGTATVAPLSGLTTPGTGDPRRSSSGENPCADGSSMRTVPLTTAALAASPATGVAAKLVGTLAGRCMGVAPVGRR